MVAPVKVKPNNVKPTVLDTAPVLMASDEEARAALAAGAAAVLKVAAFRPAPKSIKEIGSGMVILPDKRLDRLQVGNEGRGLAVAWRLSPCDVILTDNQG